MKDFLSLLAGTPSFNGAGFAVFFFFFRHVDVFIETIFVSLQETKIVQVLNHLSVHTQNTFH